MLGAENTGRVERRKRIVVRVRIRRPRDTARGTGRMGIPWIVGAARIER